MIKELTDLAIFGGKPIFDEILHVGRPNIGNREKLLARINDMLDRHWLTNRGPFVREFEQRVAELLGVKHCVAMCNGTVALEIAVRSLDMKGEVIVPSFTFIATAHSLQWQEITPVFCDIDPLTHNIDPGKIENLITPRTTAILAVHLWSRPCAIEALQTLADKHGLRLIFDASHAFGCSYKGKMIGNFGDAETFSFHATKFINSFEGGAVVTNNDDLAEKMRLMKNFGFSGMDNVIHVGTNGKMNEVCAAMGLTSLENMNDFIEKNHTNYIEYKKHLTTIPGIKLLTYNENEKNNFQYIVVEINEKKFGVSRNLIIQIVHKENIRVRRYFYPACHNMEPYRSYFPNASLLLPSTKLISKKVLCLPTGSSISQKYIFIIAKLFKFINENSIKIKDRMNNSESK